MGGDSSVEVAEGEIPEETAGPFPGDGSNGPDVLTESGVVRSDITSSFGSASGVAEGVPLTLRFQVYDLTGDDVEVLRRRRRLRVALRPRRQLLDVRRRRRGENYLRGVQESDADGWVEFTTIFPGCYAGRWPHVHFEVYESLDAGDQRHQQAAHLAAGLPAGRLRGGLRHRGYESSVANLAGVSLDSDGIFSDGYSLQMATMKGSVGSGFTATLNVPI